MQYQDYYDILGVSRDADEATIKKAYRKLARQYHPDVSKVENAEEKFKALGEAYEVLKDPEKRAAYDQLGHNWQAGQDFQPPPDWEGMYTGGDDIHFQDFSDFFSSQFGQDFRGTRRPPPPRDLHARINLTLEELYAEQPVELTLTGGGARPERRLRVKVPPQMRDGHSFRLRGQGGAASDGSAAGDLYVEVRLVPHPKFRVQGDDVYSEIAVSPWEAVLGAQIRVETLGGTVNLTVPPRSNSGTQLRLSKRGMPGPNPGHHYVTLKISVPSEPTDAELAHFQALAKESSYDPRAPK